MVHAHSARFGVCGFLALAFTLLARRRVRTRGDIVFIVGAVAMALQVLLGLAIGARRQEGRAGALRQQPQ
ncbi:MAG TPA: hypothetical protein VHA15_10680 [Burkholderiales bacterium]|nr:hypothetical protein [Burkholderiales bacterium]